MSSRSIWLPPPSRVLPVAHMERVKRPVRTIKPGRTIPDECRIEKAKPRDERRATPPPLLPHIPPTVILAVTCHVLELEDTSVRYTRVSRREKTEPASPHHCPRLPGRPALEVFERTLPLRYSLRHGCQTSRSHHRCLCQQPIQRRPSLPVATRSNRRGPGLPSWRGWSRPGPPTTPWQQTCPHSRRPSAAHLPACPLLSRLRSHLYPMG